MRTALDTNVMVYAESRDGSARALRAQDLLRRLTPEDTVVSVLALGELYHVLVRKAGCSREEAKASVVRWRQAGEVVPFTEQHLVRAADVAARHKLAIWDAAQVVAAAEAGCDLLLTEDLQDGFAWGPVQVVNPFPEARWNWLLKHLP